MRIPFNQRIEQVRAEIALIKFGQLFTIYDIPSAKDYHLEHLLETREIIFVSRERRKFYYVRNSENIVEVHKKSKNSFESLLQEVQLRIIRLEGKEFTTSVVNDIASYDRYINHLVDIGFITRLRIISNNRRVYQETKYVPVPKEESIYAKFFPLPQFKILKKHVYKQSMRTT